MGFPLDLKEVEPQLLNLAFKLLGKLAKSPDTTRSDKKYEMLAMMSAIVLLGDGSFWLGDLNLEINPIRQSRFPRLQAVGVFGSRKLWGFVLQIPRFRNHRKRTKHQEVGLILDQPGSMKQAAWPFCKTSGHRRPKVELKQNDVFPFSHVFFLPWRDCFGGSSPSPVLPLQESEVPSQCLETLDAALWLLLCHRPEAGIVTCTSGYIMMIMPLPPIHTAAVLCIVLIIRLY